MIYFFKGRTDKLHVCYTEDFSLVTNIIERKFFQEDCSNAEFFYDYCSDRNAPGSWTLINRYDDFIDYFNDYLIRREKYFRNIHDDCLKEYNLLSNNIQRVKNEIEKIDSTLKIIDRIKP